MYIATAMRHDTGASKLPTLDSSGGFDKNVHWARISVDMRLALNLTLKRLNYMSLRLWSNCTGQAVGRDLPAPSSLDQDRSEVACV